MPSLREKDPISYALSFINTEKTKYDYRRQLQSFFSSISDRLGSSCATVEEQAQAFLDKARLDQAWAVEVIISYLNENKKRILNNEITAGTAKTYSKPVKLFCDMNDLTNINWKRLIKSLPKVRNVAADRPYNIKELQTLLKYANRRLRVIILAPCSSGFRLAAWDYLKWGHISPIERDGHIIAAKIRIYANDPEEYYSFLTPESYTALKDWMDYRADHGERITDESWIMRDVWLTSDVKLEAGGRFGHAKHPKQIKSGTVKKELERVLLAQGLRKKLPKDVRRYAFKVDHGLRKFCNTRLHEVMDDTKVKNLMGQKTGLSDHYNRPDENKLLAEYEKAVPLLTISENYQYNHPEAVAVAKESENTRKKLENMEKDMQKTKAYISAANKTFASLLTGILERLNEGEKFELEQPDGSGEKITVHKPYTSRYNFGRLDGNNPDPDDDKEMAKEFEDLKKELGPEAAAR